MALRLVEIVLPTRLQHTLVSLFEESKVADEWCMPLDGEKCLTTILLKAERVEPLMDELESRYSHEGEFRVLLLSVEATVPREKDEPEKKSTSEDGEKAARVASRVSREELYHDISEACGVTPLFLSMVILSTIVAALGLLKDNTAAIIGAMVIAPLLGPNAALALATTLGDTELARRALYTSLVGVAVAFAMAIGIGLLFDIDPTIPEIAARTEVGLADIAIALAAGVAGSLAFTSGVPTSLVGVMVAVALLPPTVTCGMLAGSGEWSASGRALFIFAINVTSVNLAGVATFLFQGVRPRDWREVESARKKTHMAIALWVVLLLIMTAMIIAARRFELL